MHTYWHVPYLKKFLSSIPIFTCNINLPLSFRLYIHREIELGLSSSLLSIVVDDLKRFNIKINAVISKQGKIFNEPKHPKPGTIRQQIVK